MSEQTTTTTTTVQDQVPEAQPVAIPVQEPAPAEQTDGTAQQAVVDTPEDLAAAAAAAAAARAKAAEEDAVDKQRERAASTLKQCVTAYCKGEREYRKALLEAGEHAAAYIQQRLALGDKRDAAVDLITLELSRYASNTVDVNALVGAWHAYRLLAVEQGLDKAEGRGKVAPADAVPFGHYRDEWSRLVKRTTTRVEETWALLPGVEQDALTLFRASLEHNRSKQAVRDHVTDLVAKAAQLEYAAKVEATKAAQLDVEAKAAAKAVAAEKARQAAEATVVAKASGDTVAMAAAADALTAAALETAKLARAKEQAEAEAAKRQAAEEAARDKARKAAEKAAKANQPKPAPSKPPRSWRFRRLAPRRLVSNRPCPPSPLRPWPRPRRTATAPTPSSWASSVRRPWRSAMSRTRRWRPCWRPCWPASSSASTASGRWRRPC